MLLETLPARFNSEIYRLRRSRNAVAPISRLPNEMLVQAFAEYIADKDYIAIGNGQVAPGQTLPQKLSVLSKVSKAWQEVAQDAACLWAGNVNAQQPPSFVRAAIKNSKRHPLVVQCFMDNSQPEYEASLEICGELHRWRSANLTAYNPAHFDVLAYSGAPSLKSLTMSAIARTGIPIRLFGGVAPQLEELSLRNVLIDWNSPVLSGLRSIELDLTIGPSPFQFLRALQSSPNLVTLILSNSSFAVTSDTSTFSEPIDLIRLRRLRLHLCPDDVVRLCLEKLRCPFLADFHVQVPSVASNTFITSYARFVDPFLQRSAVFANRMEVVASMAQYYELKLIGGRPSSPWTTSLTVGFDSVIHLMEHFRTRVWWPPTSIKIAHTQNTILPLVHEMVNPFPKATQLTFYQTDSQNIWSLGVPVLEDGVLTWPMPKLKRLILQESSLEPEAIVTLIRSRLGGNHLGSGDRLELPIPLESLILNRGCRMDRLTFLKLRAMLGEGRVEWEGV